MDVKYKQDLLGRIVRHLILHINSTHNLGLLNGKMGIAIFFYHYSRYTGNNLYRDFAGELIDDIYKDINTNTPFNFEDGFCGIGWGFLHLIDEKFIDADADEVLSEIDRSIMERDVRRINDLTLYNGLAGIAHYAIQRKNMDRSYLQELIHNMDSKEVVDKEFDILKMGLKSIVHQQNYVSPDSINWLLHTMVEKVPAEVNTLFTSSGKFGIGKNGLCGIGLHLILNDNGKN